MITIMVKLDLDCALAKEKEYDVEEILFDIDGTRTVKLKGIEGLYNATDLIFFKNGKRVNPDDCAELSPFWIPKVFTDDRISSIDNP